MKIKFLGAAGTVTGSSYVITSTSGQSLLVDLGMFQGTSHIDKLNYMPYDYDCSRLIGAVLTHAHLDHCGRLPILLSKGFKADIWMTPATADLTELSLLDSAKIARDDAKDVLYDGAEAVKTIARFKTVNYHQTFKLGDFAINMVDAGHLLGSASLEIEDKSAPPNARKIVFSGDIGNFPDDLLMETEFVDNADIVVMESTYGDRLHPIEEPIDIVQSEINKIEALASTLLIPAFSLDRTQELLHMIMHLKKTAKVLPQTPVYLDSPMAQKATIIYSDYPQYFNSHLQEDLNAGQPFSFPGIEIVSGGRGSQAIHSKGGAKVIIAGAGMMTGGRIVGHAAHYLPDRNNRLLIVGYQGEETLGRELMEGSKRVVIDGEEIIVNAAISSTSAMSSHADQGQLLGWLKHIKNVKKVFLTHGEDGPRATLAKEISEKLGIGDIALPVLNQEVDL